MTYITYDPCDASYEQFITLKEAEEHLLSLMNEGFPSEAINGEFFIAKIIKKSSFVETDNVKNYECPKDESVLCRGNHCEYAAKINTSSDPIYVENCESVEEGEIEPWAYTYDSVGKIIFKEVENETN